MSFDGDLYPTAGATSVLSTKGDIVRYDSQRERYGIGSANQILQVKSNLPSWETVPLADTVLTTAGDVLYENNTPELARLPKGSDADVLTLASGLPTWSAPAGGGGNFELLTSSVLTGTATSMSSSFTAINGSDFASIVVMYDMKNDTNLAELYLQFSSGGSTVTSSYYSSLLDTTGGTATHSNQSEWLLLQDPNYRRNCGEAQIYMADSTQTASTADVMMTNFGVDANPEGYLSAGSQNSSLYAIDGVTVFPSSGNLQVGSRLSVYKKSTS